MTRLTFVTLVLASLALAGCPTPSGTGDAGNDAAPEPRPSCEQIIARCHDVDPGSGPIHDCHESAHDEMTSEATCAAMLDSCSMLCAAVDAGVVHHEDAHAH